MSLAQHGDAKCNPTKTYKCITLWLGITVHWSATIEEGQEQLCFQGQLKKSAQLIEHALVPLPHSLSRLWSSTSSSSKEATTLQKPPASSKRWAPPPSKTSIIWRRRQRIPCSCILSNATQSYCCHHPQTHSYSKYFHDWTKLKLGIALLWITPLLSYKGYAAFRPSLACPKWSSSFAESNVIEQMPPCVWLGQNKIWHSSKNSCVPWTYQVAARHAKTCAKVESANTA